MSGSDLFSLEVATDSDAKGVLRLLNESFAPIQRSASVVRDFAFWHWKYRDPPHQQAVVQVVKARDEIVGTGCLWPVPLSMDGVCIKAYQACDVAVHSEYRRRGLLKLLMEARREYALKVGAEFLFSFPNENSIGGHLKSGWTFVGKIPWYVKALRPLKLLESVMRGGVSKNVDVPDKFKVQGAEVFKNIGLNTGPGISLCRSHEYLAWRYLAHPTSRYGLVSLDEPDRGWGLFTLSERSYGALEFVLVDFFSSSPRAGRILDSLVGCARDLGACYLTLMKPLDIQSISAYRRGHIPVRYKNLTVLPLTSGAKRLAVNVKNWNFRAGMHDSV